MSVKVALMALFFMCRVMPTNLVVVVKSEIEIDSNVYYMYCGEARPSLRPPVFQNYSSAKIKPECQIKFTPSHLSMSQARLFDEGDVVVQWTSLSNDNFLLHQATVFEAQPEADPRVSESLNACFCTSEDSPTPEDKARLLNFDGWAIISPFYQYYVREVFLEEEVLDRFVSQFEEQFNMSFGENVMKESKSNEGDTTISHLFSFRHEIVETLLLSEIPTALLLEKEPELVLFELIKDAYRSHNYQLDHLMGYQGRIFVVNQTKAYNVTEFVDIPPGKKAIVTHHINYTVIDLALNETIWHAVANFTFRNTLHVLPPQHVFHLLRPLFYPENMETYYVGNAMVLYQTFIAKGCIVIKGNKVPSINVLIGCT